MIGLFLAVAAWAGSAVDPCADPAAVAANSARLRVLFDEDAADRTARAPETAKNDVRRVKEVLALRDRGAVCTPTDKYLAAAVVQHSLDAEQVQVAIDMAVEAMNGHAPNAGFLVAVIFDRHKVMRGVPQWYGTQLSVRNGKKCIFAVDPKATDDERVAHGIAPIAETFARILADAEKAGYEPTAENLVRYDLVCESKAWR